MGKSVRQLINFWEGGGTEDEATSADRGTDFGSNTAALEGLDAVDEEVDPFAAIEGEVGASAPPPAVNPYRALATERDDDYEDVAELGEKYEGEHDVAKWRAKQGEHNTMGGKIFTTALDDEGRDQRRVSVDGEGRLMRNGARLDSTGAKGPADREVSNRMIFAMSDYGDLMATDQSAEMAKNMARVDAGETKDWEYFHHSSFFEGDDVAAAGEIEAQEGLIKRITPNSGHYTPETRHTWNAVNELALDGADLSSALVDHYRRDAYGDLQKSGDKPVTDTFHAGEILASGGDASTLEAKADMRAQMAKLDDAGVEKFVRDQMEDYLGDVMVRENEKVDGGFDVDGDYEDEIQDEVNDHVEEHWPGSDADMDFNDKYDEWEYEINEVEVTVRARLQAAKSLK